MIKKTLPYILNPKYVKSTIVVSVGDHLWDVQWKNINEVAISIITRLRPKASDKKIEIRAQSPSRWRE